MAPDMLTCRTSGCGGQWPRRDSSGRVYCYACRPRQSRGSDRAAIIATVEELWHEGLGFAAIGDRVGLTKNAVVGIVNRLGLPKRRPWNARNGTAQPPRERKLRQFTPFNAPLQVGAIALPPLASIAPRKPREVPPVPRPQDRQDGALAPPRGTCQWVLSGPEPWRFCDQPAAHGTAWCNEHGRRCYVVWPPGPRRGAVSGTWAAW